MCMAHARDDHGHEHTTDRRRLAFALALAIGTAVVEVVGGVVSGSLALIADAGHVMTDASALGLALAVTFVARRAHTRRLTFGYHRAEVIVASANGLLLFAIAGVVAWHAVERLRHPTEVDGGTLLLVAVAGLLSNAIALRLLHGSDSVNVRAARLHVWADLGGSVAAVGAGVIVATTGWERADPLLSLVIVVLVAAGAARLLRDTLDILMEGVPRGVDLVAVERDLRTLPGVIAVHDIHCWTVSSGFVVFAAHVEIVPGVDVLDTVAQGVTLLRDRHGFDHVALHPEAASLHEPGMPVDLRWQPPPGSSHRGA